MGAFAYNLELEDGTPSDLPTFKTAVPNWRIGDTIPLGSRSLLVIDVRDGDEPPVPVVEDVSG
jgi:hypothetical protein